MDINKLRSAVFGFAIGDALGVPYEFKKRNTFLCKDMTGHGTWNQPAGTWSDDTSMMLATMDSLSNNNFSLYDMMNKFSDWYFEGKYTPWNKCFDIGHATMRALNRYVIGIDPAFCGGASEADNGNGALMRILPFAFTKYTDEIIDKAVALTHNTSRSKFACWVYINICKHLINDDHNFNHPYLDAIKNIKIDEIKSTGYVVDTLIAVLWCFLTTSNYEECVLKAVNLGNDTDTIAALAGGLAGLKYGIKSIPKKWLKTLAKSEYIDNICKNFAESIQDGDVF